MRPAAVVAGIGIAAASCSTSGPAAKRSRDATHKHARVDVIALVTLVGTGHAAGLGDRLEAIDLTEAATSTTGRTAHRAPAARRAIPVGTFPASVTLAPSGKTAYVADYASDEITPVDVSSLRALRPLSAGSGPAGVAVTPNGASVLVTDAGSSPLGHALTPIAVATGKAGRAIAVGPGPEGIALSPHGAIAWVADTGAVVAGQSGAIGNEVSAVDLATGKARTIPVGNAPEAIAVSPNGATVYVANANSGSVTPIATATDKPGVPIRLPGSPQAVAFAPGGKTAWVTVASSALSSGGALVPVDVSTGRAGTPIPVGGAPAGVAITPDGGTAWVAVPGQNRLVPVSLTARAAGQPLSLPGGPYALVLARRAPIPAEQAASGGRRARPGAGPSTKSGATTHS